MSFNLSKGVNMRVDRINFHNYETRNQNNQFISHSVFKGVNVEGEENSADEYSFENLNTYFQNKLSNMSKEVYSKYQKMKKAISGWGAKKKQRQIEREEMAALNSLRKAQELAITQQEELLKIYNQNLEQMKKNNVQLDQIVKMEEIIARAERVKKQSEIIARNKSAKEGFDSIGGYEQEKFILTDKFINKLAYERAGENVELPNGILFFGPNGNGKTSFAKAFAESANCELKKAVAKGSTKQQRQQYLMNDIIEKAELAQERFEETNERTIILVDEFDGIASEDSTVLPELKSFMQDCSQNYHVTIFATTNNPLNISPAIRNATRLPIKVYLDPPNKENAIAVLKHYLEGDGINCGNINYEKLADKILAVQPNSAYNNSQLEEFCKNCIEEIEGKITTADLEYQIDKSEPGITAKDLEKFEKEKSILVTNKMENIYED